MRTRPAPAPGAEECTAVVSRFEDWARSNDIGAPQGRHVVRFCADMWMAQQFPCHLGIPRVWSVLRSAGAFAPYLRRSS